MPGGSMLRVNAPASWHAMARMAAAQAARQARQQAGWQVGRVCRAQAGRAAGAAQHTWCWAALLAANSRLQVQYVVSRAHVGQLQARARDGAVVRRPPTVHPTPHAWQHDGAACDLRLNRRLPAREIRKLCRQVDGQTSWQGRLALRAHNVVGG